MAHAKGSVVPVAVVCGSGGGGGGNGGEGSEAKEAKEVKERREKDTEGRKEANYSPSYTSSERKEV